MKGLGIGLLVAGVLMLIFTNVNFTTEEQVVDLGPLEINKEKEHEIAWPTYLGGVVLLAGVGVLIAGSKKK